MLIVKNSREWVRERIFISLYLILRYIRGIFYGIEQGFFKIDLFNLSKELNLNFGIMKNYIIKFNSSNFRIC